MIFDPAIPIPWIILLAVLMVASTAWFQLRSAKHLGPSRALFLLLTRLSAILLILFLLLQPVREVKIPVPKKQKSIVFAVDSSASMAESHSDGSSRIDAARADLEEAGLLNDNDGIHRFYSFSDEIHFQTADSLRLEIADAKSTRFDTSISSILREAARPSAAALVVFSDGHDFELIPPGRTAAKARTRNVPIFTVPYGTLDSSRDVSVQISNFHPHTFIRQSTRLEAFVRTFGAPHEKITVELLRDGEKVDSKVIDSGRDSFHNVHFTVTHEEPGQFEYSFRIAPIANEKELSNNLATTYLNVIAERIRVLEIEGRPFWDSTFLRRSFTRNDKFDIDSLVAFTGDRVRPIRSNPGRQSIELNPPRQVGDLLPYQMVILGREIERVIGADGIRAIEKWVKDHGGVVIFSRGKAWSGAADFAKELEPIDWDTSSPKGARLEVTPQAGSVTAFRLLRETAAVGMFPEVISYPAIGKAKALSTTFSVNSEQAPAVVFRRYGAGQTLSLGVGNLWRWVFNPKAQYDNNAYDRFWDQISLWLLANSGISPVSGFSLRADTSNLPLGQTIHFRLGAHGIEMPASIPPISIYRDGKLVTSLNPTATPNSSLAEVEFTPKSTGRYRAVFRGPEGKVTASQFIVFREGLEQTETAMDKGYLEQLASSSGGRMIGAEDLRSVVDDFLRETSAQEPLVRRESLWDKAWIYYLLGFLLALDWYTRRRWGLT